MRRHLSLLVVLTVVAWAGCGDDSSPADSAVADTAASDSAVTDSGSMDSAAADSGSTDSGAPDATLPDGAMCIPEGGSRPVVPGALSCCTGLESIACGGPASDGSCEPCAGASFCTFCGNGTCSAPENRCNCPADCS